MHIPQNETKGVSNNLHFAVVPSSTSISATQSYFPRFLSSLCTYCPFCAFIFLSFTYTLSKSVTVDWRLRSRSRRGLAIDEAINLCQDPKLRKSSFSNAHACECALLARTLGSRRRNGASILMMTANQLFVACDDPFPLSSSHADALRPFVNQSVLAARSSGASAVCH